MKTLLIALALIVTATSVNAATYYGNSPYSREIRKGCERATSYRDRKKVIRDIPAAKRCFAAVVREDDMQRLDQSYIDVNNAMTDYLIDRTRLRNRR